MRKTAWGVLFVAWWGLRAEAGTQPAGPPERRAVALTFDDLPFVSRGLGTAEVRRKAEQLLAALQAHHAPAIGFVNEGKLAGPEGPEPGTALLNLWLDAGLPLGNHTYSHISLTTTPLEQYEADVLRGEAVTRKLVEARGLKLRYFRHPFTHTGPTPEIKAAFEAFLQDHGYTVAPFTVEDSDYLFDLVYARALRAGDEALAKRVRTAYLDQLDVAFGFFEGLSRDLFGREIPQILLVHANELNGDVLDEMLHKLEARGYGFVALDQALADEAYRTPDRYVGKFGPSWLHRWSVAKGTPMRLKEEPDPPDWLLQLSKAN
jgi:peptidoglycan/xylan/chitin deacetylase (PgdA/CDA1 family)